MMDLSFYKNKKILVTGHTGFKGTWLCELLNYLGSEVYGYALEAEDESLYNLCNLDNKIKSYVGDIRDFDNLLKVFKEVHDFWNSEIHVEDGNVVLRKSAEDIVDDEEDPDVKVSL